jgi:hypothetical protein
MMKSLTAAWQSAGVASGGSSSAPSQSKAAAPAPSGGPEHLTKVTAGDRSAIVGLPDGWRLTRVAAGSIAAEGPHHELVNLGVMYQNIIDPRNPRAQSLTRMPNYAKTPHLICPLSGDLFSAFVNVSNQARRNIGKPPGTYKLTSSKNLASDGGPITPVQATFTVDYQDGAGPRKGVASIGAMALKGSAIWALTVSASSIPEKYAAAENATLLAIIRSYSQDAKVIASESAGDMDRIRQAGERSKIITKEANQRREQSQQSFENHMQSLNQNSAEFDQHMANIDWSSKLTQDYILDRSVAKDNDYDPNAAATVNNKFADSIVRASPDRFEIVQNQDLIRGRDY